MKNSLIRSLMLCLAFVSAGCFAQEPAAMPEPTKEHAWLDRFVGQWKTELKGTAGPGQPPMECLGTMSSRKLGGYWVVNEMKGEMTGIQTIGYDAAKQKYVGIWVDSMTAFMWQYEGSVDPTGKTLTLQAKGPNFFADGTLTQFEDIYEFTSEDQITISSRILVKEGEWVTFLSGTAKRVK